MSRNLAIFIFDAAMLVTLCVAESVRIAGIAFHEWFGISLVAVFLTHLLLSWNWVAAQTKQIVRLPTGWDRINYLLNFGLFVVTVLTIFTGVAISEAALPAMGFAVVPNNFWHGLHNLASTLMLVIAGLHIALNWDWILKTMRQRVRKAL